MAISIVERSRGVRAAIWCVAVVASMSLATAQRQSPAYTESVVAIQKQMQSGDLDGARAAIAQALKKYPADGGLENLLGVIEVQEGHVDAARRDFDVNSLGPMRVAQAFMPNVEHPMHAFGVAPLTHVHILTMVLCPDGWWRAWSLSENYFPKPEEIRPPPPS